MKRPVDFSYYLVTKREGLTLEAFCRIVRDAVLGGITLVQLREKHVSFEEMCFIGKSLLAFLKPLGIPLIINDNIDVAHAIQADGVHLGQHDDSVERARAILGEDAIIGLSVETPEQAIAAHALPIDYIAASPVFATPTKTDCATPWGLVNLQKLCKETALPVIAIGGIGPQNIAKVWSCGVSGIAIVSAVFEASDPKEAVLALKQMS